MKKLISKNWPITLLILSYTLIIWPLFLPGYFGHHDDLQVMRIFEMRKCFNDLQIPCRWVPDMGYGNGFPLFNYYSALPYYIGGVLTYFFSYIVSAKILFLIPLLTGGLGVYLLLNSLFGRLAALVGAILFSFAPYRALDIYVRGAIAESWGLSLAPLVFYFSYWLIRNQTKANFLGTSLSLAAFLLCHNIMTMFFLPLFLGWVIFWWWFEKPKQISLIIQSFLMGFGLASFFLLPAFLEKNLVHIESLTSGGTDYRGHFVTLYQLFFSRYWGYGASVFGPNDTISFQIGWPHWWIVVVTLAVIVTILLKPRVQFLNHIRKKKFFISCFFVFVFFFSAFMTHERSLFIWEKIPLLPFVQFPWRFLAITIFSVAFLGGFVVSCLLSKFQLFAAALIISLTVILNWFYFKPEAFYTWMSDNYKLTGQSWDMQQKAGLLDYLPITATDPAASAPNYPEITSGKVKYANFVIRSNSFSINAWVEKFATIEFPIFDFPNWIVEVKGKNDSAFKVFPHTHKNYLGRIQLILPEGQYQIKGKLLNTPIRTLANTISILSSIFLIVIVFYGKNYQKN